MKFIQSTDAEIPCIMDIIEDAQLYLAAQGIDQWQDGYPNKEQIAIDINNEDSYVITNDEGVIIGTTVFTFKKELTYNKIEGSWETSSDCIYGVVHRLAVADAHRSVGLAKFVFDECEARVKNHKIAKSLRIDTHRDNKGMQNLLKKRNYNFCGIIVLDSGDDRLAFEKTMN